MEIYFSDHFRVSRKVLERYGAFNISVVTDLPLFIDPFLLFNSRKRQYRRLHDEIIQYLAFLKSKSEVERLHPALINAWYAFPEVKQTWLGFTETGNRGSGLGPEFAGALNENLSKIFGNFGNEQLTKGSHLEKLCLIKERVGRDNISDFTTNLIKGFLCEYTQKLAQKYIGLSLRRTVAVQKVQFNYVTESLQPAKYDLPWANGDFVLLTPKDILTKDDTWINKTDLIEDFESLPNAIPDENLRAQINNYFFKILPKHGDKEPTDKEEREAAFKTIQKFPELIDAFIRYKEDHGDEANSVSDEKVKYSDQLYVEQARKLREQLRQSDFYKFKGSTYEEAHERIAFLKDVIENKGGHRLFYVNGQSLRKEQDVQIMYRLTWFNTELDVGREVNDGRGPVDYKISEGRRDKTLVEFKLAKNTQLRKNLQKQVEIYQKASDAPKAIKVIVYFSKEELTSVSKILKELNLTSSPDVVLIDARNDNKPSGSKA